MENNDVLVATNVIADRPPELRPTGTPTACAYLYANHFCFAKVELDLLYLTFFCQI